MNKLSTLLVLAVLLFVVGLAVLARAQMHQGSLLLSAGVTVHPTAITPTGASVADSSTQGTIFANLSVTMSDHSIFTGSLQDTDASGISTISAHNLVAARNLSSTDDGNHTLTITACQNACLSIPFSLSVTALSAPAPAVRAGFTTLAYHLDGSSPNYASRTSPGSGNYSAGWLGCNPDDGQPHEWYQAQSDASYDAGTPCEVAQVFDSVAGKNVISVPYKASYGNAYLNAYQGTQNNFVQDSRSHFYPNAYWQITMRTVSNPAAASPSFGCNGCVTTMFSYYPQYTGTTAGVEEDHIEYWMFNPSMPDDNLIDGVSFNGSLSFSGPRSGFDPTQYNTWGSLITGNSTSIGQESFWNGTQIGAGGESFASPAAQSQVRVYPIVFAGVACNFNQKGDALAHNCMNAAISSITNCGDGTICLNFSSPIEVTPSGTTIANITGVTGSLASAINGPRTVIGFSGCVVDADGNAPNQNACSSIKIEGSSYGSGSASGGTFNPFTEFDQYIADIQIWSCSTWQTAMCQGAINP